MSAILFCPFCRAARVLLVGANACRNCGKSYRVRCIGKSTVAVSYKSGDPFVGTCTYLREAEQ